MNTIILLVKNKKSKEYVIMSHSEVKMSVINTPLKLRC